MKTELKQPLEAQTSLPAVGQGALGIENRKGDESVRELIKPLIDSKTMTEVLAERAMNATLEGSCSVAIAGYAVSNGEELLLKGFSRQRGSQVSILRAENTGTTSQPKALGELVANQLLEIGAGQLLEGG